MGSIISNAQSFNGKVVDQNQNGIEGVAIYSPHAGVHTHTNKDGIGNIKIDIEQQPANPWGMSLGGSIGLGKRFEMMPELGSNFKDNFLGVVAGAYRFRRKVGLIVKEEDMTMLPSNTLFKDFFSFLLYYFYKG